MQPWAVIYNKLTDKTKSIWIHMNCGADGNQYPTPANVNQCTGGPYQEGKLIALNTGRALFANLLYLVVSHPLL